MSDTGAIIISLLIGFGLPTFIAFIAYKVNNGGTHTAEVPIRSLKDEKLADDMARIRLIQETEFWDKYGDK